MEQNTFLITESELQQLDILSQKFDSRALFILLHAARSRPGVPAAPDAATIAQAQRELGTTVATIGPQAIDDPPDTFEPIVEPQETSA